MRQVVRDLILCRIKLELISTRERLTKVCPKDRGEIEKRVLESVNRSLAVDCKQPIGITDVQTLYETAFAELNQIA